MEPTSPAPTSQTASTSTSASALVLTPTRTSDYPENFDPYFRFPHLRSADLSPAHTTKYFNYAPYLVTGLKLVCDEKVSFSILLNIKNLDPNPDPYQSMAQITLRKESTGGVSIVEAVLRGVAPEGEKVDLDWYFVSSEEMDKVTEKKHEMYKAAPYGVMSPVVKTFEEYMDIIRRVPLPGNLERGGLYNWLTKVLDALQAENLIAKTPVWPPRD